MHSHSRRGAALFKLGLLAEAIDAYDEGLDHCPGDASLESARGVAALEAARAAAKEQAAVTTPAAPVAAGDAGSSSEPEWKQQANG